MAWSCCHVPQRITSGMIEKDWVFRMMHRLYWYWEVCLSKDSVNFLRYKTRSRQLDNLSQTMAAAFNLCQQSSITEAPPFDFLCAASHNFWPKFVTIMASRTEKRFHDEPMQGSLSKLSSCLPRSHCSRMFSTPLTLRSYSKMKNKCLTQTPVINKKYACYCTSTWGTWTTHGYLSHKLTTLEQAYSTTH